MAGPGKGKGKGKAKGAAAKANGASGGEAAATKSDRRAASATNVKVTKRAMESYAERYNELLDEKEKLNGECMSDIKNLLEKAANESGLPRAVLRKSLQEQRRQRKEDAEEKEMEPLQLQQLNQCRAALGLFVDTPLGTSALAREGALSASSEASDG